MFSLQSLSFFLLESMRKFTIFTQTTMPLEYIQNFAYPLSSISLGMTVVPWRNWRQWSSNISFFWGGGEGNNVHHGLCENGERLNTAGYLTICCFCFVNRFSEQISYSQHLFLVRTGSWNPLTLLWKRQNKTQDRKTGVTQKTFNSIQFNKLRKPITANKDNPKDQSEVK